MYLDLCEEQGPSCRLCLEGETIISAHSHLLPQSRTVCCFENDLSSAWSFEEPRRYTYGPATHLMRERVLMSQMMTVSSSLPVARRAPEGEKLHDRIAAALGCCSCAIISPVCNHEDTFRQI